MRAVYIPLNDADWAAFYMSKINHQKGHGIDSVFEGMQYQRGHGLGSFFKGLFKMLVPVGKKVVKSVGKEALKAGAGIAGDIAQGENFKESLKRRGIRAASNLGDQAAKALNSKAEQSGGQLLGVRKRRGSTIALPPPKKKTRRRKTIKEMGYPQPRNF